jgi:hypothetical protein
MSGDYVGVGADDIVAAGACKLGADARLGSEVPDLHGSVVATAHHLKKLHRFM